MEVSCLLLKYKMGIVVVKYEDHCCWYAIFKIPLIKTIIFNLFTKNPAFAISNSASLLTKKLRYSVSFIKRRSVGPYLCDTQEKPCRLFSTLRLITV